MNYQQFRSLVSQMRAAQRAYFKGRATADLEDSKRLEKAVDAELASNGQRTLLDEDAVQGKGCFARH